MSGGYVKELRVTIFDAPDGRTAVLLDGPWDRLATADIGDTLTFVVTAIEEKRVRRD